MNIIFSITSFLGAYLLFVIQPMAGKLVLPVFGGTSMVWTTVLLFFTVILLFGYGYVVWLTKQMKVVQFRVHAILIVVTTILLLGNFWSTRALFSVSELPFYDNFPVLSLVLVLGRLLAIPAFLLATTSTLVQSWYAHSRTGKSPYWLYTISNAGSLIGLLAYPLVLEPNLTLGLQQLVWVWGFVAYGLLILTVTVLANRNSGEAHPDSKPFKIQGTRAWFWFALPFVSTLVMLAITTQLTQSISPFPLIWVATLGVYLLSYIVAFIDRDWYPSSFYGLFIVLLIIILGICTSGLLVPTYPVTLGFALFTLFIIDLVCHRELFSIRPEPHGLTIFYLMIGLGGVAASIFASIIAPSLFSDIWEYPLVLIAVILVAVSVLLQNNNASFRFHSILLGTMVTGFVIWLFINSSNFLYNKRPETTSVDTMRNFYGVIHILQYGDDKSYMREIVNGATAHGAQNMGDGMEYLPVNYGRSSPFGQAILNYPKKVNSIPVRIGVIGLGAGEMATYCDRGDAIRFYEINPNVIAISRRYFTYLANAEKSGCKVEVIQGDARIALEKEREDGDRRKFDILIVDAFHNYSIPTHLLTQEAIELYLSHINDGGIIVVNIVNAHLTLIPVIEAVASDKNLYLDNLTEQLPNWVILSRHPTSPKSTIPHRDNVNIRTWTDDYSNMLQVLVR